MIATLASSWGGALPFAGGLLDQPVRLVVLGHELRRYERAFVAVREAELARQTPPLAEARLVDSVRLALAREAGERLRG